MSSTYSVNAIGPVLLAKTCVKLLTKASTSFNKEKMCASRAAIINISSNSIVMRNYFIVTEVQKLL